MKGLNKRDLKKGTVYRCLISNRAVLITTHFQTPGYETIYEAKGWVYNPITGGTEVLNIADGQLIEMPE